MVEMDLYLLDPGGNRVVCVRREGGGLDVPIGTRMDSTHPMYDKVKEYAGRAHFANDDLDIVVVEVGNRPVFAARLVD